MNHSIKCSVLMFFGCWLTLTGVLWAQEKISGRVIDAFLNKPLPGVAVQAGDETTQTDAQGRFSLEVEEGKEIVVRRDGYQSQSFSSQGWTGERTIGLSPANSTTLPEVVVQGFGDDRKLLETNGGLSLLTQKDFDRGNKVNAAPVLNTVPGVRVDQADMEDSRVSIRGAGLRANYGIRDIALFVDEIPLTQADGFTRIEGLDLFTVGKAEIIKGPASSLYGAGIGGAMRFETQRSPAGEISLEPSGLYGSYGMARTSGSLKAGLDNASLFLTYGNQWFDGYTDHSQDYRSFATALGTFYLNDRESLTVLANQSYQRANFAGAVEYADYISRPRWSDPTDALYNIHRWERWTRFGFSHRYAFDDRLENVTSVFSSSFTLDHPYGYGYPGSYLNSSMQNVGARTRLTFKPTLGEVETRLTAGGSFMDEYQLENYYTNTLGGIPGNLDSIVEDHARNLNLFFQGEVVLEGKTFLSAGVNINETVYHQIDRLAQTQADKVFDPTAVFRVGASHVFEESFSVFADVSQGFSPPIFDEMADPATGGLLTGVKPQLATQFEGGTRGNLLEKRFGYDLTFYDMEVSQELIPQTVGFSTEFVNAGKTSHLGAEAALSYDLAEKGSFVTLAKPWLSYSRQQYVFVDYVRDGVDYSRKKLTGNPENQFNLGIDLETEPGLYFSGNYQFVDRYPVADDNLVFTDAYGLLAAKVGFKRTLGGLVKVDLFAGGENLLDQLYPGYIAFNAPSYYPGDAPNYYKAGNGRTLYGGGSIGVLF